MNTSNPILDTNQLPTSSMPTDKISKQSVILDGVNSLATKLNGFSRMTITVLSMMGVMTVVNFGTTIAAILYLKDMHVDNHNNVLLSDSDYPVGTSSVVDLHESVNFPSYDHVLQSVASGMAVSNGSFITRVESGVVDEIDGSVMLHDANGNHIGTLTVENDEPQMRHLEGLSGPKFALVNSAQGTSRLCPDPAKGCYDMWKRECIPCSGEWRGIKQDKKGSSD